MSRRQADPSKPRSFRISLEAMLQGVLKAAPPAWRAPGLYIAQLTDERALAFALHIHERQGGPDPNELLRRALCVGVLTPRIVEAAPISVLARALHAHARRDERGMDTMVREMAAMDATPVVILESDVIEVTTLHAIQGETEPLYREDRWTEHLDGWFWPTVRAEA